MVLTVGFDTKDSVELYCATVTLPAFTKGKKELSGIEVKQTRRIANIRQKYCFLSNTQPIDYLPSKRGESVTSYIR